MLDEVREYGLYTIEPPRNLKKEQCRLKFANLIKKDFGGLVRAMTIIARQYIFSGGKEREDFDEENVRERLASWCDGWLNQYIRHTFLAQDLDSLSNRVKDGTLLDLLHGMEPDCEIDRLMAARDDFLNRATDLDKDSKELFGRVSAAISALKRPTSLRLKRTERVRLEFSIESISRMRILPTPSNVRFFTSSFPSAPAPTTMILAFCIFS